MSNPESVENPYQAPSEVSDVARDVSGRFVLADRGTRLVAVIIDGLIAIAISLPIMYLTGYVQRAARNEVGFLEMGLMTLVGFGVFVAIHGTLLAANGQTIGKKVMGIRIADMEGRNPGLAHILLARYLPLTVASIIPVINFIFPLADVLFIFGGPRRCIHDLIAGTQVLKD